MFTTTLNFGLGEDVDALRDLVRAWAQERIAPSGGGDRPGQHLPGRALAGDG